MRRHAFIGVSALLFAGSTAATIAGSLSMADMGGTPMPGGWTLSGAWMPMCGQSWADAALSFMGMWVVMMVAMMLPSLVPVLWREACISGTSTSSGVRRAEWLLPAGIGYFFVWTMLGLAVFVLGATLAHAAMQLPSAARAVPKAWGLVVLLAGVSQFSAWKSHHLACIGHVAADAAACTSRAGAAWRHGVQLGLHCCQSCAGLTAMLLALGVMDLRAMGLVTAAITAERLSAGDPRITRAIGVVMVGMGLWLVASSGLIA